MHISNSYSLQRKMETKKGLFDRLHTVGLLLKIIFLLSFFGMIWSLWTLFITGFILICDILVTFYRTKVLFTYDYRYTDGEFRVIKITLDGKERVIESLKTNKIENVTFSLPNKNDIKYYSDDDDSGEDRPMKISGEGRSFFILSDDYLYSILCFGMRETV